MKTKLNPAEVVKMSDDNGFEWSHIRAECGKELSAKDFEGGYDHRNHKITQPNGFTVVHAWTNHELFESKSKGTRMRDTITHDGSGTIVGKKISEYFYKGEWHES
jgi:hypothetical protein